MNQLLLPRTYEDKFGNYPQHVGKPKLSYSQYSSWNDPLYEKDYIRAYFMGHWEDGGIFAQFGSACGTYFENLTVNKKWLSVKDIEVLCKLHRPENAKYEVEVVIDRGWYVIQGFIDQEFEIGDKRLKIHDLKTGNVDTKRSMYAGDTYQQTTLYSYQREVEGYHIDYSGVILLGRKGSGRPGSPLKLSGVIEEIPTPYSVKRAEEFLMKMDETAEQVAEAYLLYNKLK